ncbi:MAG: hypothetical protein HZY76_21665 [Anaerolineae bacterium]|nr:MAG: hypothetical protein HZY76_21665 [Anaerolineae bacterium]
MTDETTTPEIVEQAVEAPTPTPEGEDKRTATGDILNELNRLGTQIVSTVQAAWASPKRKEVTDEPRRGSTSRPRRSMPPSSRPGVEDWARRQRYGEQGDRDGQTEQSDRRRA